MKINPSVVKYFATILCCLTIIISIPALSYQWSDIFTQKMVSQEYQKQVLCMAENIYFEAGSESFEGKKSVAQIVLNRVNSGKFASDICSVVYQKNNGVYQFSWVGLASNTNNKDKYIWEESLIIANEAMTEPYLHDVIYKTKSLYYHNLTVNPKWKLKRTTQIGHHIFYASN